MSVEAEEGLEAFLLSRLARNPALISETPESLGLESSVGTLPEAQRRLLAAFLPSSTAVKAVGGGGNLRKGGLYSSGGCSTPRSSRSAASTYSTRISGPPSQRPWGPRLPSMRPTRMKEWAWMKSNSRGNGSTPRGKSSHRRLKRFNGW
ncbi:unnamed protein product [Phytomonas sp. Hart1]|nr:unnamed protein product [Phytomonas sp. Hart1]|eukprot:CCW67566.1 unnamed protein product [Phytomonas sp. isolate Hart1]